MVVVASIPTTTHVTYSTYFITLLEISFRMWTPFFQNKIDLVTGRGTLNLSLNSHLGGNLAVRMEWWLSIILYKICHILDWILNIVVCMYALLSMLCYPSLFWKVVCGSPLKLFLFQTSKKRVLWKLFCSILSVSWNSLVIY